MKNKILFLMLSVFLLISIGNVSAGGGGTITTDGLYTVHTFTSNGVFNISSSSLNVSVLVVAGGGGGGYECGGGGGGGGVIYNTSYIVIGNTNIIIGVGGNGSTANTKRGLNGGNSSFGTLESFGGGGGGSNPSSDVVNASGANGGSGGGACGSFQATSYLIGGLGLQGYNGGNGSRNSPYAAGGGGGAGITGGNGTYGGVSGAGGDGLSSTIYNGTTLYYGGGGGGYRCVAGAGGAGGAGGGTAGGATSNSSLANSGGGSGGSATGTGTGGSGIVIVRYLTTDEQHLVVLSYPTNNLAINTATSSLFNVTLQGITADKDWKNNTYYIWYSNGTLRNTTIVTGLSGSSTNTSRLFNFVPSNYLWNSFACYNNATFGNCSWSSGNFSFNVNSTVNSNTYNVVSYETSSEIYMLNITSPTTPTNAFLVYNGTSYSATVTNTAGNFYNISKTLQIPSSSIGINTFYYKWDLSSTYAENSSSYNQTIKNIQLGLCNASLTIPYLNISFKDEATDSLITASIPSSTFVYYLGDGSITKTLTFINSSVNLNYAFCALPGNKTYYIDPYVQYKNGTDYPQRIWDADLGTYTNSTTNQTLYLLSSTDGIYVTFQVSNVADQVLSGVEVNAYRTIGSTVTLIATGTTSGSGSVTFWLNPDFEHIVNFSKAGYTTYTFQEPPTQTSYTIQMATTTTVTDYDYSRGLSYLIKPKGDFINNNTIYNFNLSLTSSYWDIDSFGFSLYWGNGTLIGSNSLTTVGLIGLDANTTNQTYLKMFYYYKVNSTYTNFTKIWYIEGGTGREFSIWHFFEDLTLYLDSDLFGIDNFGKALLSFVILVMITGGMIYRYGIQNEATIFGLIFGLVLFLDYGVGLIPNPPIAGVQHFVSILFGLLMIVFVVKEETE